MYYAQRRRDQSLKTEQAILKAALDLMRRQDFDHVSVRDICKAAGITTGAFYHHFPSKEAMLAKGFAPLEPYIAQALVGHDGDSPQERLWRVLQTYGKYIEEECGELSRRYYQRRIADPRDMAPLDPARDIHAVIRDCLRDARDSGLMPSDADPVWLADFCYRHFRGVVIDWLLKDCSYSLQAQMGEDYTFFKKAFLSPPAEVPGESPSGCPGDAPAHGPGVCAGFSRSAHPAAPISQDPAR